MHPTAPLTIRLHLKIETVFVVIYDLLNQIYWYPTNKNLLVYKRAVK